MHSHLLFFTAHLFPPPHVWPTGQLFLSNDPQFVPRHKAGFAPQGSIGVGIGVGVAIGEGIITGVDVDVGGGSIG